MVNCPFECDHGGAGDIAPPHYLQGLASEEFPYLIDRAAKIALRVLKLEIDVFHGIGPFPDGLIDPRQNQIVKARQHHSDADELIRFPPKHFIHSGRKRLIINGMF
jgi:hypothetical protein